MKAMHPVAEDHPQLAVGRHPGEVAQRRPAGPDDELADAPVAVDPAVRVLRGEALVVVVVAVDDDVDAGRVQRPPEAVHRLACPRARPR